jgi:hypothetical protein
VKISEFIQKLIEVRHCYLGSAWAARKKIGAAAAKESFWLLQFGTIRQRYCIIIVKRQRPQPLLNHPLRSPSLCPAYFPLVSGCGLKSSPGPQQRESQKWRGVRQSLLTFNESSTGCGRIGLTDIVHKWQSVRAALLPPSRIFPAARLFLFIDRSCGHAAKPLVLQTGRA